MAMMGVLVNYLEVGMGTFTKGPWHIIDGNIFSELGADSGDGLNADPRDGWHIASIGDCETFVGDELVSLGRDVKRANAQLIAAAPDLLESLENLLDAYSKPDQRMCCSGYECGCMGSTIYDQAEHYARAAISRAKGEK